MPMDGTQRRSLERVLIMAGGDRLLCVLYAHRGEDWGNRIVEPYKLYNSPTGERLLHCYQVAGADGPGWRSLPLREVDRIVPLEVTFTPRGEYAAYANAQVREETPRLRLVR